MSWSHRGAGALLLTAVLATGTSVGPASAAGTPPEPAPPPTAAAPPPPAPDAETTDLRISAAFDRPTYAVHETVTARVRVTNGGATAVRISVQVTDGLVLPSWDAPWVGAPVEPGQAPEGTLTGQVRNADQDVLTLVLTVAAGDTPDVDPTDNSATISVPLTRVRGSSTGTAYGDLDGDGTPDPGEALAGLRVTIDGGVPDGEYSTVTDAEGRFGFRDLPAGSYRLAFDPASPWWLPGQSQYVDGVDDPDVLVRGVGRVSGAVSVALSFDRQDYREGDLARVTATLTNGGPVPIHGLVGEFYAGTGAPVDHGELGTGLSLPAGTTRSTTASLRVDRTAWEWGHVSVSLRVGAPLSGNASPTHYAYAAVPGGRAPLVVGALTEEDESGSRPRPGAPLPGLVVFLRDLVTGVVVARTTTGGNGGFAFHDLPAGAYGFFVVGPWQVDRWYGGWPFTVRAGEDGGLWHAVMVVPGQGEPDPGPVGPPGTEPPPAPGGGAATPPLAATGVGVSWLALGGLLSLLLGIALVHRSRSARPRR
ncbi:carboxypeptidase regulatory-like domain-containing protein [Saccharothrix syringae]|uniref:Alpha-amylase n=1 Tax=Saccharothrix syringae TaxID=103733 RepID=A0A5Q0H1L9_SACSY|nr:carboxypeptidase regulatory-like domain-containing protein [Saccharothrix syringae]QFZ19680.1 hypothetical protein EKG83_21605 [Saccharothrix syringae]